MKRKLKVTMVWCISLLMVLSIVGPAYAIPENTPDTPANSYSALDEYVAKDDPSYRYTLYNSGTEWTYKYFNFDMVSQSWNPDGAVVGNPEWHHWLQIIVPHSVNTSRTDALLIVNGNNSSAEPPAIDSVMAGIAVATGTVVINLNNVPSQPIKFVEDPDLIIPDSKLPFVPDPNDPTHNLAIDEYHKYLTNGYTEDGLIAYTFNKFLKNGNSLWPAYLPMVKSVVKAMDTVQTVAPTIKNIFGRKLHIEKFFLAGASKRGWTVQLATAVDPKGRVFSMMPLVSDMPNLAKQMANHKEFYTGTTDEMYNNFSLMVMDYTAYTDAEGNNTFERLTTERGQQLLQMVDPYAYRNRANMNVPKYYVNGACDEFYAPGSSEFYIHEMQNNGTSLLRYVPNGGHALGVDLGNNDVYTSLLFFTAVTSNSKLPLYDWTIEDGGKTIRLVDNSPNGVTISGVKMWKASNSSNRDYRIHHYCSTPTPEWSSTCLLPMPGTKEYVAHIDTPTQGSTAFFVEITYMTNFNLVPCTSSVSVVSAPN